MQVIRGASTRSVTAFHSLSRNRSQSRANNVYPIGMIRGCHYRGPGIIIIMNRAYASTKYEILIACNPLSRHSVLYKYAYT
jgi:hypothetical protein